MESSQTKKYDLVTVLMARVEAHALCGDPLILLLFALSCYRTWIKVMHKGTSELFMFLPSSRHTILANAGIMSMFSCSVSITVQ